MGSATSAQSSHVNLEVKQVLDHLLWEMGIQSKLPVVLTTRQRDILQSRSCDAAVLLNLLSNLFLDHAYPAIIEMQQNSKVLVDVQQEIEKKSSPSAAFSLLPVVWLPQRTTFGLLVSRNGTPGMGYIDLHDSKHAQWMEEQQNIAWVIKTPLARVMAGSARVPKQMKSWCSVPMSLFLSLSWRLGLHLLASPEGALQTLATGLCDWFRYTDSQVRHFDWYGKGSLRMRLVLWQLDVVSAIQQKDMGKVFRLLGLQGTEGHRVALCGVVLGVLQHPGSLLQCCAQEGMNGGPCEVHTTALRVPDRTKADTINQELVIQDLLANTGDENDETAHMDMDSDSD